MTEHARPPSDLKVLVVGHNPVLRRGVAQYLGLIGLSFKVDEASFESAVIDVSGDFA